MKKLTLAILLASGLVAVGQTETNLQIRVDVPAPVVEQARIYMWITGETNVNVRTWLSSNLVVTLPPAVTETVNTRKADMISKIQEATLTLMKKVATEFGY